MTRINQTAIRGWLSSLGYSTSTKRNYRATLSSFCTYLVDMGKPSANPVSHVRPPKAFKQEMRYSENFQAIQLVEMPPEPFRTISALMHATRMEISAVLHIARGDLDTKTWLMRAHGKYTSRRDR